LSKKTSVIRLFATRSGHRQKSSSKRQQAQDGRVWTADRAHKSKDWRVTALSTIPLHVPPGAPVALLVVGRDSPTVARDHLSSPGSELKVDSVQLLRAAAIEAIKLLTHRLEVDKKEADHHPSLIPRALPMDERCSALKTSQEGQQVARRPHSFLSSLAASSKSVRKRRSKASITWS